MQRKKAKISKKLLRVFGKTNAKNRLIAQGDKVLVALSGGKDSLSLLHLIANMQQHAPFDFEYQAVTISYGMDGENYDFLKEHCKEYSLPYDVYETQIFDISQETMRENSSYCSYFSRMRRGALYTYALEHGFNKIALGHHLDDAVESFFMNMLYNGSLRSMPPIYKANRGVHVIRPLIEAREEQLRNFADENNFLTIGDEACPAMKIQTKMPHARANTKEWLKELEKNHDKLFTTLKASFSHIHDDTFLDPERWVRDDLE
ncbi:MAG TPA: tRNA 2-thiocytidine biosynthesis protein TtcA [Nitratifractor sp.]|nr:tRNA 2-thiocytidine biosynthesis protein TtcA [Nitratifractor sp.]